MSDIEVFQARIHVLRGRGLPRQIACDLWFIGPRYAEDLVATLENATDADLAQQLASPTAGARRSASA